MAGRCATLTSLPDSVLQLADQAAAEDIALAIFRAGLPEVEVVSAIRSDQEFPVLLVRRLPSFAGFEGDIRFLESMDLAVHAITTGVDADQDAWILSKAAGVVLRDSWLDGWSDPNLGSLSKVEVISAPRRVPDWATSLGPVQYADLPSNGIRYESRYHLVVRRPRNRPYQP